MSYFKAEVSREKLKEYMALVSQERSSCSTFKSREAKREIESHLAFEVISQFADINGEDDET